MPAGPCCLCGKMNYPMSCGGPRICPSCDCGHPPEVSNPGGYFGPHYVLPPAPTFTPHGCICPPCAEKTCQGLACPRRGITAHT